MTIISGHKGFIGSLLFNEIDAIGIDLKDGKNLLTCDLPEAKTIYHLAAQTSVEASWHDPVHDADNLKMVVRLVHNYPNAKIIYTNSAASLDQSSPYGFSKWSGAEYLKKFHKDYVICTLPNVYGKGSKSVVDIFKDQEEVTIYGTGDNLRDYVHVSDIVEGLVKAQKWPKGEYQLGSGISTSVLELAEGKIVNLAPARKEALRSVLRNTTPNWQPILKVMDYLNDY